LLSSNPGGIQQELVVQDLPGTKVVKKVVYLPLCTLKNSTMEEQAVYQTPETAEPVRPMWKHAVTYGLYYAILSILISVIVYMTGSMQAKPVQWLSTLVMIAAIVVIQFHYRKAMGGYLSYGQSVGVAVLSMLFAAIPIAVYTYILYKFIDPGLIEQIRLAAEEQMVERGLPEEQINTALAFTSKFQTPGILAFSQFFNMPLTGLIIGLISSIFVRKKSPDSIFE